MAFTLHHCQQREKPSDESGFVLFFPGNQSVAIALQQKVADEVRHARTRIRIAMSHDVVGHIVPLVCSRTLPLVCGPCYTSQVSYHVSVSEYIVPSRKWSGVISRVHASFCLTSHPSIETSFSHSVPCTLYLPIQTDLTLVYTREIAVEERIAADLFPEDKALAGCVH
jgi:hypothetical protein